MWSYIACCQTVHTSCSPGCWHVWFSEEHMGQSSQTVETGDKRNECIKGSIPSTDCTAVGTITYTSAVYQWLEGIWDTSSITWCHGVQAWSKGHAKSLQYWYKADKCAQQSIHQDSLAWINQRDSTAIWMDAWAAAWQVTESSLVWSMHWHAPMVGSDTRGTMR